MATFKRTDSETTVGLSVIKTHAGVIEAHAKHMGEKGVSQYDLEAIEARCRQIAAEVKRLRS